MTSKIWEELELSARNAVLAGGITAMGYYRNALGISTRSVEEIPNPSTNADYQSTLVILQSLSASIPGITARMNMGHSYFGEELEKKAPKFQLKGDYISELLKKGLKQNQLAKLDKLAGKRFKDEKNFLEELKKYFKEDSSQDLLHIIELAKEDVSDREERIKLIINQLTIRDHIETDANGFQKTFKNCLGTLFDAIDGTTNFNAGLPLFCTALAFFIDAKPCVSAIYDPHHHTVYYGSIRGKEKATAYSWGVQSGTRINLIEANKNKVKKDKSLISLHLTRSNLDKKNELIEKLFKNNNLTNSSTMYMINSGQLALSYVASNHLSCFLNNTTKIWDVAAGEVLIKAVGGNVTDFNGKPISYRDGINISVVASLDSELHNQLLDII